ncbi:hypothetical protein EB796_014802 [Bugula neritina]|uniref:Uncharacterized protein n=1 Tax=Bugula neritina TaxID=10212 RepID=A0A7J7JKL1_BUGNE|nr:hypothetical protein EB796_014802 [Bugula neritina]
MQKESILQALRLTSKGKIPYNNQDVFAINSWPSPRHAEPTDSSSSDIQCLLQHRPLLTVNTLQADISDDEGEGDSEHNYRSPTKSYHLDEFNSSFFAVSPSGSDKQTFQHTSNTTKALPTESMSRSCESQVDPPVVARAATPSGEHNSIKREETLYVTSPENVKLWYLDAEYKKECERKTASDTALMISKFHEIEAKYANELDELMLEEAERKKAENERYSDELEKSYEIYEQERTLLEAKTQEDNKKIRNSLMQIKKHHMMETVRLQQEEAERVERQKREREQIEREHREILSKIDKSHKTLLEHLDSELFRGRDVTESYANKVKDTCSVIIGRVNSWRKFFSRSSITKLQECLDNLQYCIDGVSQQMEAIKKHSSQQRKLQEEHAQRQEELRRQSNLLPQHEQRQGQSQMPGQFHADRTHVPTQQQLHADRTHVPTQQQLHADRTHVPTQQQLHADRTHVPTQQQLHADRTHVPTQQQLHADRTHVPTQQQMGTPGARLEPKPLSDVGCHQNDLLVFLKLNELVKEAQNAGTSLSSNPRVSLYCDPVNRRGSEFILASASVCYQLE